MLENGSTKAGKQRFRCLACGSSSGRRNDVTCVDGIWLARNRAAVLIACTDDHVIGCHLARSENSKDRGCSMRRIAAPDALVCDGAGGIGKAMRAHWPNTKMNLNLNLNLPRFR